MTAALGVGVTEAKLSRLEKDRPPGHHLLYLPSGKYLRIAALGNAEVAADLLYLWSIQFYGSYQIEDRYPYVEHIYSDIITELDPHYFDPYWIGALILSVEMKDLDRALALLDKGFRNNPDRWIFPYLAGWECAHARQYERAAAYFRQAASVPSAPPDVARLVAGMYQKSGDPGTAIVEWSRIAKESSDPGVRTIAENRVKSLRTEIDLRELRSALERYRSARGGWPGRLSELALEGWITRVPRSPDGEEYAYDRTTGTLTAPRSRVISR